MDFLKSPVVTVDCYENVSIIHGDNMAEADKEFVENVVKAIVDHPDDVKTKRSVDEMGVLIELSVHAEDMGKIIGKEGRTAKSIRTLLRVLGAKNNARVNLKIIEPEGGREVSVSEDKPEDKEDKSSKTLEEGQATEVV